MADPVDVVRDAPSMPLAPVDPNVHIPESAKRASALADSYYAKTEPAPEAPHKDAQPTAPPAEQPANEPATAPDYEHMYRSMKGRFDQQNSVNSQLAEELRQQQIFNQRMREQMEQAQNPPQPKQYVSEEERQQYGDDFFNVVAKRVQEVVGDKLEKVDQIEAENQQLKQQLQRTANQTLAQLVTAQVPNWRDLNNDPGFQTWLSLRDIYSGQSRHSLLENATRRSDAPAIIAFYKGYLASQVQQPQVAEPAPPAPVRQAAVSLEALVAPGAPRPATVRPDLAPQKQTYTRNDIRLYYEQKRRGLWAGRDAEWNALERDFTLAPHEGRIVG